MPALQAAAALGRPLGHRSSRRPPYALCQPVRFSQQPLGGRRVTVGEADSVRRRESPEEAQHQMGEDRADAEPGDQPAEVRRTRTICARRASAARSPRAPAEPDYRPPPPTVSPRGARRVRPARGSAAAVRSAAGRSACFPPTGSRPPPVAERAARSFGPHPAAGSDGFDAPLGSRMWPTRHQAQSPWWKPDAARDPWRDPASPFWLGRPAVFTDDGSPQLSPDRTREYADEEVAEAEPKKAKEPRAARPRPVRAQRAAADVDRRLARRGDRRRRRLVAGRALPRVLTNGDVSLGTAGTPANRPPGSVADIAKRVSPAVVSIAVHGRRSTGSAPASSSTATATC